MFTVDTTRTRSDSVDNTIPIDRVNVEINGKMVSITIENVPKAKRFLETYWVPNELFDLAHAQWSTFAAFPTGEADQNPVDFAATIDAIMLVTNGVGLNLDPAVGAYIIDSIRDESLQSPEWEANRLLRSYFAELKKQFYARYQLTPPITDLEQQADATKLEPNTKVAALLNQELPKIFAAPVPEQKEMGSILRADLKKLLSDIQPQLAVDILYNQWRHSLIVFATHFQSNTAHHTYH